MDDFAGWTSSSSEVERLAAFWLFGDVFVTPVAGDVSSDASQAWTVGVGADGWTVKVND